MMPFVPVKLTEDVTYTFAQHHPMQIKNIPSLLLSLTLSAVTCACRPGSSRPGSVPCKCVQAFDELLLLKRGGRTIFNGPTGHHFSTLIAYFESVDGVPRITEGLNPATYMLEVMSAIVS